MKFKVSERVSLVALAFIGSSTLVATGMVAFERAQGVDFGRDLEDAKGKFSLLDDKKQGEKK
jgi:hypothetical protein